MFTSRPLFFSAGRVVSGGFSVAALRGLYGAPISPAEASGNLAVADPTHALLTGRILNCTA